LDRFGFCHVEKSILKSSLASSANSSQLKLSSSDLWPSWILAGYGDVMAVVAVAGVLMRRLSVEIGTSLTHALLTGWFLLTSFYFGQQVRVARLENRLADLESAPRP
jgi:hypothetical protein